MLAAKCRVFLDSQCLLPGDDWDLKLSEAQARSRITVVIVSEVTGQAYYEREEIATAIAMARENENLHRVVPIFLEKLPPDAALPYGLRLKHGISASPPGDIASVAEQLLILSARLNQDYSSMHSASAREHGSNELDLLFQEIDNHNLLQSRRALLRIKQLLDSSGSRVLKEAGISRLRDFLAFGDFEGNIIPDRVREVRRLILQTIRALAGKQLNALFQNGELEYLDLYGFDFSGAELSGVSFRHCFLVEANFAGAVLDRASFHSASIRNVNFTGARLKSAEFIDADWFNASGLILSQLQETQKETLLPCPANTVEMHRYLQGHYMLPFSAWLPHVQEQLLANWHEYLRTGGLCGAVAEWEQSLREGHPSQRST